jgi:anion-transporting  ArsA/GET3 family ATPase
VPAPTISAPDRRRVAAAQACSVLERQMAFVTGKGGVGKTTVAAALALAGAQNRRPAIVCELAARGDLARAFGRRLPRSGAEVELAPRLRSVSIDPDAALEEWLSRSIGRPGAALLGRSDAFRYFVAAAPGAREMVSIGKAWDLTRSRGTAGRGRFVVVDGPSSGHAVGLLQAPRTFSRLGGPGPIGHQAGRIRDFLADPSSSAIVLVCTPSEMPVTETVEIAAAIEETTGRPADLVIANQVLPDRFDADEAEAIDRALGASDDPRLRAALAPALRARGRACEQEHELARLHAELAVPVVELPFLFVAALGPSELRALSAALVAPAA